MSKYSATGQRVLDLDMDGVLELVDELLARIEALEELTGTGQFFAGFVDVSALGSSILPDGWNVSNAATGRHTLTHNLGLGSPFTSLSLIPTARIAAGGTDDRYAAVTNPGADTIDVITTDSGSGLVNEDFFFIAQLNS